MLLPRLTISPRSRSRLIGIALVLAAVLLWGTVPVGTRALVRQQGVFSVAFLSAARLVMAAIIFIVVHAGIARRRGLPVFVPIRRTGWLALAALGLLLNYQLYGLGLRYTTAGATSIIAQIHAVATVLLAAWVLGERLTARKVAGMALATAGVLLAVSRGTSAGDLLAAGYLRGNLIQIGAALAWPLYAVGQSRLQQESANRQALVPVFALAALAAVALLPFSGPAFLRPPVLHDWLILAFLGVVSTAVAYWLYSLAIQRLETSECAVFSVLSPPCSLLLAYIVLGEPLGRGIAASLALVVGGLVLMTWRRSANPLVRRRLQGVSLQPAAAPMLRREQRRVG